MVHIHHSRNICRWLTIFILFAIGGCKKPITPRPSSNYDSTLQTPTSTIPPDTNRPWIDSLNNAFFHDPSEGWVRLVDGSYEVRGVDSLEQWPVTIGVGNFEFIDLNKDGFTDAVGLSNANYGGSGIFISMEAFINRNGSALHVSSFFLGDRICIDSLFIVQDTIDLLLTTQGPGDAMCCPTLKVQHKYFFRESSLVELKQ